MQNNEISNARTGCLALFSALLLAPFLAALWLFGLGLCGGALHFLVRSWGG